MARPKQGELTATDAARIGRAVVAFERSTNPKRTGNNTISKLTWAWAKITEAISSGGGYAAIEVLINDDQDAWEDKVANPRIWGDGDDELNPVFDIAFSEELKVDTIVLVVLTNIAGLGGKGKWVIVAQSVANGERPEVDKSITYGRKEVKTFNEAGEVVLIDIFNSIEFVNDIHHEVNDDGSSKAGDAPNMQIGSAKIGQVAYAAQEQGTSYQYPRHWRWLSNFGAWANSILIPGTGANVEDYESSSGGFPDANVFIGGANSLWIRFVHKLGGSCMEIYHGVITASQMRNNEALKHPSPKTDTVPNKG